MAKLIAWINGERTGTLTLHHNGALHFQYDANWLQHPLARPLSLSLPLQRAAMHSEKVVHFFENLLFPDWSCRSAQIDRLRTITTRATRCR